MSVPTATTSTTSLAEKPEPPKLSRSFSLPITSDNNTTKKVSWREKVRARREPPVVGKEKWRDATLSEKERWKEWHKAKDAERKAGSTAGYYTSFYKAKGGWAWWLGSVTGS
ncbi:hypothetical protein OPT61_g6379 [Boeremia exigua]|uniref:Uncharacterized protein n=1 Tax=Boeremia exigua TaxID=749465 RepID=A0ACC2I6U2_9PLEO|nr:hypothetical protein OPT61_g6379 [Boeremia exigua]